MIPKVKNILYVSDLEDGSRPAFRMAISIAEQYAANIVFLHVITPIPESVIFALETNLPPEVYKKLQQDGIYDLKEVMNKRITEFCDVELESLDWLPEIESIISKGEVHSKIVETAALKNADMIVMGTRTHSASKQFFMGSVANKVMRSSDVPVLVVPLN
ncbi:MAG: nucleotide-binding universal stress UspA family protein [Oceanospirillaceae bacterium]|jgi:nucleotide-binding universal stress UspA family protein